MPNSELVFPSDPTALEPRFHPPCDKAALSATTSGLASATVAAGATGQRHVATGATFSVGMTATAVALTTVAISIIDGSTGGTTYLWRAILTVQGTTTGMVINTGPVNLAGSAATALTAEFSAALTNATEFVTLTYHDIGNV